MIMNPWPDELGGRIPVAVGTSTFDCRNSSFYSGSTSQIGQHHDVFQPSHRASSPHLS